MVQRYDSRRKPLYKDLPWYSRNRMSLFIFGWSSTMFFFFGPWIWEFIKPRRPGQLLEVNPRNNEDLKKLKETLIQREREMCDSPYGRM